MLIADILKNIDFEEFVGSPYEEEFSLKKINRRELEPLHGEKLEKCFYVVEGSVRMIFYSSDGRELTWVFESGSWFGMEDLIAEEENYPYDIEATEDTILLEVPLRKLLTTYKCKDFYLKLLKIIADTAYDVGNKLAFMMNHSHEEILLKFLQDNGYKVQGKRIPEISELLKINLRTLQRIIKGLEVSGIIIRDKDSIRVKDLKKYDRHSRLPVDTKIF